MGLRTLPVYVYTYHPFSPPCLLHINIISLTLQIGKQARVTYDESPKRHEQSPPNAQKVMANPTEPAPAVREHGANAPIPDAYSVQPGDVQNRVAQADGVAAHHAEANQSASSSQSKGKRAPDDHIAKIIQEENESKSKFPRYPGLERWQLLEKMGDGAFSNVYRARDLKGDSGEVAIKVVRKFEMNNMQVSFSGRSISRLFSTNLISFVRLFANFSVFPYQLGGRTIGPKTFTSGF